MAINKNESHKNRHTLTLGMTGSGKTHWLINHPLVKKRGGRLLVWDPYESHNVHYAKTRAEFARMVSAAVQSGKGFRLGLAVNPTESAFEFFCQVCWAALDGRKDTVILPEELGDVARSGKASPAWGRLVRVGRKYGAILMPTTQRPQEIDKTLFTQVGRVWVGLVSPYDQTYVEKNTGLERGSLQTIKPESYKFAYVHGHNVQWGGPGMKKVRTET